MGRAFALAVAILVAALAAASAQPVQITADAGNPAKKCVDQYWAATRQAVDSFGCLSRKIVCVDVVVSGQTVTAASTDVITDQDFYNVIHNGIAQGGGTFNGFSINFVTISALSAASVSAVDNYLTGGQLKFVFSKSTVVEGSRSGCVLLDPSTCTGGTVITNTVPKVVTVTFYPVGPFPPSGGRARNRGSAGGDRCVVGQFGPDATPPNVGASTTLSVQASAVQTNTASSCGFIGVAGAVAGTLFVSGIPGIVAAVGSVVCTAR